MSWLFSGLFAAILLATSIIIGVDKASTIFIKWRRAIITARKRIGSEKGPAAKHMDPVATTPSETRYEKWTMIVRIVWILSLLGFVLTGLTVIVSWRNSTAPVTLGNASFLTLFLVITLVFFLQGRDGRG